jgi:hypothetical protein
MMLGLGPSSGSRPKATTRIGGDMNERTKLRGRLTYANVMATVAVFIALGGASYAATQLPKNAVGTKQLKKNAVTPAKIKNGAVTAKKVKGGSLTGNVLADGTITGAKVQDGSLSGADIDQSSLTSLRLPNLIGMAMNSDCTAAVPFPAGVFTESVGESCKVTFASSILNCTAIATVGHRTNGLLIGGERTVQTVRKLSAPNQIITSPSFKGASTALPVDLALVC